MRRGVEGESRAFRIVFLGDMIFKLAILKIIISIQH
jgi:hypothetical protein